MITIEFLEKQGFEIIEDYPTYAVLKHKRNERLFASCGKCRFGEIFIGEKHWINDEYERMFSAVNPTLTESDYFTIINYLVIKNI